MARLVTPEYTLDLIYAPFDDMKDEEFHVFCEQNKNLRIERDENYQIFLLPPVISTTSLKNADLAADIGFWNRKLKAGMV